MSGHNAGRTFHRDSHGSLTELRSSPTATGGTGVHPTDDDRYLHVVALAATMTQDPRLANGLKVLKVAPDGTPTVVDFVPLPSFNGSRPQGIAVK